MQLRESDLAIRIDRPRFRALFSRLAVPTNHAEEIVDVLEDTFDDSLSDVATNTYVDLKVSAAVADLKTYLADREARMNLNLLIWLGIVLSAIGVATAVLIAVLS